MPLNKYIFLAIMLLFSISCERSFNPIGVEIEPTENDNPPNFRIDYSREETSGSNGILESVQLSLRHHVNGNLVDYGNVSFGGVILFKNSDPGEPPFYHGVIQTNFHDGEFDPKFRFDQGHLIFKSENSKAIKSINTALSVPPVRVLKNVIQNQVVDENDDWQLITSRKLSNVHIILTPLDPKPGTLPIDLWQDSTNDSCHIISSSNLRALKEMSQGKRYLLTFQSWDLEVDSIEVSGKMGSSFVYVPVDLISCHYIEFII